MEMPLLAAVILTYVASDSCLPMAPILGLYLALAAEAELALAPDTDMAAVAPSPSTAADA